MVGHGTAIQGRHRSGYSMQSEQQLSWLSVSRLRSTKSVEVWRSMVAPVWRGSAQRREELHGGVRQVLAG